MVGHRGQHNLAPGHSHQARKVQQRLAGALSLAQYKAKQINPYIFCAGFSFTLRGQGWGR